MQNILRVLILSAALTATPAFAQPASAPPILDGPGLVGPPPAAGSPEAAADRLAMRAPVSEPRLAQARADQAADPFLALRPVFGETFTAERLPRTQAMFTSLRARLGPVVNATKDAYKRERPYTADPRVLQCDPPPANAAGDPSYPSGHAALGWAWALVMAELAPAQADAILARGRDFGESRLICGFHYPSDIAASRLIATSVVARLHADPAFSRDLDAARRELRNFRR